MEMTNKEVSNKIIDLLQNQFSNIGNFHTGFVNEMVEYLDQINGKPESLFMQLHYSEYLSRKTLIDTRHKIQSELIDNDINYGWRIDKPRNDYEKGLYCAMHFIDALVNWMNPD